MRLNTPPPPAIVHSLKEVGLDSEPVVIALQTDINQLGQYNPQWLVATKDHVFVCDEKDPQTHRLSVPMSEAEEFRTIGVVGSGLLQVKTGGIWIDLLRYSNRLKYPFSRTARLLDHLRKGEAIEITPEDEQDPRRCPTCGLMLEFQGESCPRCIDRGRAMSRVVQLMRPYWAPASLMMGMLIIAVTLDMIAPRLVKFLVDDVLKVGGEAAAHAMPYAWMENLPAAQLLLMVVGVYALVQILRQTIQMLNGRLGSRVATSITFDVRGRLVDHLEQLSMSYYDKQQTGSLVGRVAYDTEAVQGFVAQLTSGFLYQILLVLLAAASMFSLDWKLACFTLIPAPFVLAGTVIFYRYVYPHYERFWDRSSKQAGMLNGLLTGIRVVKAFAQEKREFERFQHSSTTLRDARRRVDMASSTFYPMMALVFATGGWIVWYIGGSQVLGHRMSIGTLMAFFAYLGLFYTPLNHLANLTTWLTQFTSQMHRIFEVLDTPIAVGEAANPVSIPQIKGDIEFRRVTFGYSRQTPVIRNVSFKIDAGQNIGVVGRSGSGKTTLINLISRFYDIDEGQILIDGAPIQQIAKNDVRSQIGVVLQEPFLFRGTLWENLVYGRTDASVEAAIAASRAGNAHDFIMRQIYAYDTWVGERGAGLSGGERQRLSIARALLCEPRILILDEATSSVDSESELAIQQALAELVRGRTSIIIAHRLSTLRNCDRIMVIEEGKLAEQGTHAELMKLDGKYAKLVKIQGSVSKDDSIDTITAHEEDAKKRGVSGREEVPPELVADPVTGLTPIAGHRPRWLRPEFANIHLGNRGALHVTVMNERIYTGVFALRCMPVRHPNQYLSLRWFNAENREQEIGLIRDLAEWPLEAQKLVQESLLRRYFVHTVKSIESIKDFQGYLAITATTDLGPADFIMRWSYSTATDYGARGKILLDVEENRYLIPDVSELPEPGRKRFERYIYW